MTIRKGMILKLKDDIVLKVIETANYLTEKKLYYWVELKKGKYRSVKVGDHIALSESLIKKYISQQKR